MKTNENVAHIVYASDDNFAGILGVSLVSLYKNSQDLEDIVIYVLDSGLSEKNRNNLIAVSKKYNRSAPVFIKATDICRKLGIEVSVDRGSLSQYARLFISSDLPEHLSRVIYLDCDILVEKSIKELWNLNLHGKTIAALMDSFSVHYRKNIDLEKNDIMFNSGVMVIDLDLWKANRIEEKLLEFITRKNGIIQQGDQGVLNHVLSKEVFCFAPRFNAVTIFFDFTYKEMLIYRKPPEYYSEALIQSAVEDPYIIHFTTSIFSKRPWIKGCQHKYVDRWLAYKEDSPWKDEPLRDAGGAKWKKRAGLVLEKMPRGLSLRLASIPQAYCRPYFYSIKKNRRSKS